MKKKLPVEQENGQDAGLDTSKEGGTVKARRRALLTAISLVGATQLPRQWTRPVVDHVLLPAHAQVSLANCFCTAGIFYVGGYSTNADPTQSLTVTISAYQISICATLAGNPTLNPFTIAGASGASTALGASTYTSGTFTTFLFDSSGLDGTSGTSICM